MAYDAHRPDIGGAGDGYFESNGSAYTNQYNVEPRDRTSARQQTFSSSRPSYSSKMTSAPDRAESSGTDVSPELIAAITERIKREGESLAPVRLSALLRLTQEQWSSISSRLAASMSNPRHRHCRERLAISRVQLPHHHHIIWGYTLPLRRLNHPGLLMLHRNHPWNQRDHPQAVLWINRLACVSLIAPYPHAQPLAVRIQP